MMEMTLNFNELDSMPDESKIVIIKYRRKDEERRKNHPFELGSGYRYRGEWWVGFTNPINFPNIYEVLAWANYDYDQPQSGIYNAIDKHGKKRSK